ncbi:MAG: TIGR00725 family protein [Patescibacteria group bacterium]|nr:TIGR00725 family protein [Patescibacteria group bacterium]
MKQRNIQIGIIGPEEKNLRGGRRRKEATLALAEEIGRAVAAAKAILITGGCSGVVEAACRGAYQASGIVVGTPGRKRGLSVPWVTVEICTPVDIGDYIFAGILSSDAIIVIPGDAGTLAEFAIAYRYQKPLIFIKGFGEDFLSILQLENWRKYPYYVARSAQETVKLAMKIARKN